MSEKINEKPSGSRVNTAVRLINRVIRYMLHYYKIPFLIVVICILITAIATVVGATFPQTLIDDHITPMLESGSRDFSSLASDLIRLVCIMATGVITAFTYNRIMVNVSQGTMRHLRDDLFRRMESLPIKYFDTHAHGDIMSVYTNDVDTLRQLLSQSIPQIINSVISMIATLITMIVLNPFLTVISILTACVMLLVTANFSKLSGKYYVRQQIDLGAVDGFIEEMLDGQKVVKVFCHEQEAMAEYPLQITSVGYNLASIMTNVSSSLIENAEGAQNANTKDDDTVKVVDTISSMFSGMSDNDLKSLKKYLESGESNIDTFARSIRYSYAVTPSIYQPEDDGYYKIYPSSTSASSTAMTTGTGGAFNELPADATLYEDQYMLRAGHWPQNSHECVLVLTDGGMVTDTLMYTLGFRDRTEMQEMMQAMQSGQNVELKEYDETYSYDSFLGLSFKVISPSLTYQYDEEHNVYTSFENDKEKMKALLNEQEDMVISGIVQPVPDSDTVMLQTGIYYPASLTLELMDEAQNSDVVKAQLDNPDINVFTGKSFTDENAADSFSMEDLFTVDETALQEAFSIDPSALNVDPSSMNFDLSNIDTSSMIDPSALSSVMPSLSSGDIQTIIDAANITISTEQLSNLFNTLIKGYDTSTIEQYSAGVLEYLKSEEGKTILCDFVSSLISDEASAVLSPKALQKMVEAIMQDYAEFAMTQPDPTDFETNIAAYMQTEEAQNLFQQQSDKIVSALVSIEITEEDLTNFISSLSTGYDAYAKAHGYVDSNAIVSSFENYLNSETVQETIKETVSSMVDTNGIANAMTNVLQSSMSSFINTLSTQISTATSSILQQVSAQLTTSMQNMMGSLSTNMQSMFNIDPEAFANVIKVNMSANEIAEMMSSLMNNTESSYKTNLTTLGYADEDAPEEIDIYPVNFAAKGEITNILDTYNENMQNSGQEDKVIIYADLVAAMMSSVTTIVDTISYVLIAFVAISLIVSSIMIGVITYISVLERRKEIGILRALGASKHNVAQVFNAETFITGLLAGAIGVGVSWLLLIPGNAIIHAIAGNTEINAILPIPNAIALVLLSILLTIIAGLLPSRKAANSDPVTALRTE